MLKITNKVLMFLFFSLFSSNISAENSVIKLVSGVQNSSNSLYSNPFFVGTAVAGGLFVTGYGAKRIYDHLKLKKAQRDAAEKEKKKKEFMQELEKEAKKRKEKKFFAEKSKETRFVLHGHKDPENWPSFYSSKTEWVAHESAALAAEEIKIEWAQDQRYINELEETANGVAGQISNLRQLHKMVKKQVRQIIFPEEYDLTSEQIKECCVLAYKANLYKQFDGNYKQCALLQHTFGEADKSISRFKSDLFRQHTDGMATAQSYINGYDQRLVANAEKVKELHQRISELAQEVQECFGEGQSFYSQSFKKVACACSYCKSVKRK